MFLPIPGLYNREFVKTAPEILRGKAIPGKNVLVVGGGMTGAETMEAVYHLISQLRSELHSAVRRAQAQHSLEDIS